MPTCAPGMSDPGGPVLFGANRSRDQLPKWPSMVSQEDLFQECMAVPCPECLWFQLEGPRGFPILPQLLRKPAQSSIHIPLCIFWPARGSIAAHHGWSSSLFRHKAVGTQSPARAPQRAGSRGCWVPLCSFSSLLSLIQNPFGN